MTLRGLDRMRLGAVEEAEVGRHLLPQARTDSEIAAAQAMGFDSASAVDMGKVKAHGRRRGTGMKVLEMQRASTAGSRERETLLATAAGLGTREQGTLHAGTERERGLDRMRDTAMVVLERPPFADTAVAALEIQLCGTAVVAVVLEIRLCGTAAVVEVQAKRLCDTAAVAVGPVTQLAAGSGTATVAVVREKALGRTSHVWRAVLARRSESTAPATGPCRMRGTAAKEVPAIRLEAGTAGGEGRARLLGAAAAAVAAGRHACASSVSRAVAQATRLARRVSGRPARAGASWCGRASRAC